MPGAFATNRGFLSSIVRSDAYNLPFDHAASSPMRIAAVTLADVNARARELLQPDKLTWVVVGDLEKIEESVRALEFGDLEVWDAYGARLR